ncbi:MAG: EAL domain-containing protein [Xanthomonadales bacterium]|nr:EAL domain-containing protein [Xanthomonadales bacterium]
MVRGARPPPRLRLPGSGRALGRQQRARARLRPGGDAPRTALARASPRGRPAQLQPRSRDGRRPPGAARAVLDLLERSGADPDRVAVEITESTPIRDLVRAQHLTALLRARGVRIAIDDFGAGASHMRLLAPLSIDFLKIDGAFVRGLPRADSERLFRGIVALARELGIETVAEGVETDEQHERLASAGIDYAQGFREDGAPRLVAPDAEPGGAEAPARSVRAGGGGA